MDDERGQEGFTGAENHYDGVGEASPAKSEVEEGKAAAILGYIPFLCFIPLIKMRDNEFALRHGKQGLLLFMVEVVAVFFMFDVISDLFWGMVLIIAAGVAVVGILYAIQGKEFTIPYLGSLADRFNI